jgi:mRNA-degrading endonuclease RelE of RelBE toxin-antitoxin system
MTLPRFWRHYRELPKEIQKLADKNFELLKSDPHHRSLHFKKVGKNRQLWSVRVGVSYRALGTEKPDGILWFWIGPHSTYDKLLVGIF